MESFLDDYIDLYEHKGDMIKKYIRECYENLITIPGKSRINSIILVKRYKGNIYREDISILYQLFIMGSNENVGGEEIKYLYENNYLSYEEFVKKYDNCMDERDINHFDLYLIDHLQPEPVDIKIALKD
jgi:hypothetical protein